MSMTGRVWTAGDDINTDLILPIDIILLPRDQRPRYMFRANRPGWSAQVTPGDIMIAGKNFGMGSGRAGAQVMKDLGIACLVAESINGLFFRNSVNFALPALEVPGVLAAFAEGDMAEVDFEAGSVRNVRTGVLMQGSPWPESMLEILRAGGLEEQLESKGMLHPKGLRPAPGAVAAA